MPPRRTTRATPATTTTPTTTVTNAQLQALIDQGVAAALAERDASRSRDGDNSHGASLGFQGTKEVIGLTHMGRKMESVFLIKHCAITKSGMIKRLYCPRGEIKKLESEYWNLKVRGTDLMTYNQRFQELALMCDRMFPEESAKVERYVGGLSSRVIPWAVLRHQCLSQCRAIEISNRNDGTKRMITAVNRKQKNKRKP
ncbi:hypothetical protein Tco_0695909 [Tanacetum coccineum]